MAARLWKTRSSKPAAAAPQVPSPDLPKPLKTAVSVIVPVFNAMPYLTELLNSLEAQDLDHEEFEVIAVDDGSSDFGGEILDVYAKRNPNFRVVHQENSGWAGKPRNVGIAESTGEYVFFCDADDRLGPEALKRMVSYARKHRVDVLVPKMVGIGGRRVQASLFRETVKDVPMETILRTLSPQKMIRRSLLIDNGITFREEKVRLEDGMAMVQCYMVSTRTSILADYDYYEIRTRHDGQNISENVIEPTGYVASLHHIAGTVRQGINDRIEAEKLNLGLFVRKGLRFYEGERFLGFTPEARAQWIAAHRNFLAEFVPEVHDGTLHPGHHEKTRLIRRGDIGELTRLAEAEMARKGLPLLKDLSMDALRISFELGLDASAATGAVFEITDRARTQRLQAELSPGPGGEGNYCASMELVKITALGEGLLDCSVQVHHPQTEAKPRRIVVGVVQLPKEPVHGILPYSTKYGNLSLDMRPRAV
ncbi:hypothetical protein GCM10023166_09200 [Paeniglutamicibacter cryotolerans]